MAQAAGGVVSHAMIAATRKVKEKGEPELHEAVKRGRIGVQDAAKVADLPPEQQKAIAVSPKPRRAAAEAAEVVKNAHGAAPRSERDRQAALRNAWDGAKALRVLWETADEEQRNGLSARFCWKPKRLARPGLSASEAGPVQSVAALDLGMNLVPVQVEHAHHDGARQRLVQGIHLTSGEGVTALPDNRERDVPFGTTSWAKAVRT